MGFFSRKKKAAGEPEDEKHGTPEMGEIQSIPPTSENSPYSENFDEKHKSTFTVTAKPVNLRQDSMASMDMGRTTARPSISEYQGGEYSDDEDSAKSMRLRRKWKSYRLAPGEVYEKPWVNEKIPHREWERYIFYAGCLVGSFAGAYIIYSSYASITNSEYCPILEETFDGIDTSIWNYEIQRGGFGVGSFEWTTTSPENIYVDDAGLHIVPTLTIDTTNITETEMLNGATLNLTTMGICTTDDINACGIKSNATSGSIINPVRSARINTSGNKKIKYGKVEVVAKMPKGDWLWPAIWMMPQDSIYGTWPQSGEIDIAELRGNAPPFQGGRNQVSSTLHWGPNQDEDAYWKTMGEHIMPRTDFSEDFHTFGLEWGAKYLFCYLDSRLLQVLFIKWTSGSMWTKGDFGTNTNQSALNDPWSWTGRPNTPFDQEFYLILNVAVGGTNGFFVDGVGNKPWVDNNVDAPRAFWDSVDTWLPTWGEGDTRGMTVQSVKMYELGACAT